MTKLLEEVFSAVSQLPQTDQDAIAALILEKIGSNENATPTISSADIESLKKLYRFKDAAEVLQFLERYPFLVSLVLNAHESIRQHFPDSPLFLQYVPDPEINDPQLVVCITTDINSEEAIDKLDEFEAEWYQENPNRAQGKMHFSLDWLEDDI